MAKKMKLIADEEYERFLRNHHSKSDIPVNFDKEVLIGKTESATDVLNDQFLPNDIKLNINIYFIL
jgi:hypothetical protein